MAFDGRFFLAAWLAALPAWSAEDAPSAQDRERARGLLDAGDASRARGNWDEALRAYRAADRIMSVPTTGIEVGRAQAELGLWIEARDTWVRVARHPATPDEPEPFTRAREEAKALAVAIAERIPTLLVHVEPDGATCLIELDGEPLAHELFEVPVRVNPGRHELRATHVTPHEARVLELRERSAERVVFRCPVPPGAATSSTSDAAPETRDETLLWTGFGVGAAGLVAGTITGVVSIDAANRAHALCRDDECPPAAAPDLDLALTTGWISTIAFALGGVGVGVGLWQLFTLEDPATARGNASVRRDASVPDSASVRRDVPALGGAPAHHFAVAPTPGGVFFDFRRSF